MAVQQMTHRKLDTSLLSPDELEIIRKLEDESGKSLLETLENAIKSGEVGELDWDDLTEEERQTIIDRSNPQ